MRCAQFTGGRVIFRFLFLILGTGGWAVSSANAAFDAEWTFNNDSYIAYTLTSVSSTDLYAGPLPVNNPTINLVTGKRYRVTVVNPVSHPLQILAKGTSSANDTVLLYQGGGTGSWESDAGVDWQDLAGGVVEFTLTPALLTAMSEGGKSPGYRCSLHTSMMRGSFLVPLPPEPIPDPLPDVPRGTIAIELETLVEGLPAPLGVLDTGDTSGSLLVYDQSGLVVIVRNGQRLDPPFLDVRGRLVKLGILGSFDENDYDERGLLGVALHPNFLTNGRLFTYTSEPTSGTADFPVARTSGQNDHQSVIAEWRVDPQNTDTVLLSSRREILRLDEPQFNHNGGDMVFGPDGSLYIGLGDGGNADDQGEGHATYGNGQSIETVLGKLLRIAVDGTTNSVNGRYGIPPDNPFVGKTGIDEIYAYGFRNPYRFCFDSVTGDLYVGDVGQNQVEEVDRVTRGNNYGWRYREGGFFFDPNGTGDGRVVTQPVDPKPSRVPVDPVAQYDHGDGLAVVGGYVYRAGAIAGLDGHYVFGDFTRRFDVPSGRLFYLDSPGDQIRELRIGQPDRSLGHFVKGFGQDRHGNVYLCASTALGPYGTQGKVFKIVAVKKSPLWWIY
jgi:glucose/arabinose dehydrogenase